MWLAGNKATGLPLTDTTICYGVDAQQFDDWQQLCGFAKQWDFDWNSVSEIETLDARRNETVRKNEGALRLTFDILLRHISEQPDGWYVIWHDDTVLATPYTEYTEFLEQIGTDSEVCVVLGVSTKLHWHAETRARDSQRWEQRRKRTHSEFPLYQGVAGMLGDVQIAVTPRGAKHLLQVSQDFKGMSYEFLLYEHLPLDDPHVWSFLSEDYFEVWGLQMSGDIWPMSTESGKMWLRAWQELEAGNIVPIRLTDMHILRRCSGYWELMYLHAPIREIT